MHNWQDLFPNVYNNFNGFLIEVTTEIIPHLEHSTCGEPSFSIYGGLNFKTYINSSRDVYDTSVKNQKILQLIEALIIKSMSGDCDCGFCYDKEEFANELHAQIAQFAAQLVTLLQQDCFDPKHWTVAYNPKIGAQFIEDYQTIVSTMLQSKISFLEAENQLLFWHNAIPEDILQIAALRLRLEYIKSKLKNSIA